MKFEKTGRTIDREIDRIVKILETRVRPQAERGATEVLRRTADLLEELANRLEKKRAAKPARRQKSAR